MNDSQRKIFDSEILCHEKALRAFAVRLCGDYHAANDLVQVTFISAIRFIDSFQPGTNGKSWLYKILHNQFTNDFRRKKREPERVLLEDVYTAGNGGSVAYAPINWGVSDEIAAALVELSPSGRAAAVLAFIEGYSYKEISQIMDIPLGTVRSKLHKVRKDLYELLGVYATSVGYNTH